MELHSSDALTSVWAIAQERCKQDMKQQFAAETVTKMSEMMAVLNDCVAEAQSNCDSEEEFIEFRRAIGAVMGEIHLSLLHPLFVRHPDLVPEGLKDMYPAPDA
jgi:hypothetical protein